MTPDHVRRTLTMTFSLAASFGLLVLVAVGAVLAIGLYGATENTVTLLRETAAQTDRMIASSIKDHFDHAELQVRHVARALADGTVTPDEPEALARYLHGAMAGMPEVHALLFVNPQFRIDGAERLHVEEHDASHAVHKTEAEHEVGKVETIVGRTLDDAGLRAALPKLIRGGKLHWDGLRWSKQAGEALIVVVDPVRRNGAYIGSVVAMLGTDELSHSLSTIDAATRARAFILHGRDAVLAHADMDRNVEGLSAARPLPSTKGFSDPVLAAIWDKTKRIPTAVKMRPPLKNHSVRVGGVRYEFLYRERNGFAGQPLIVGAYVPFDRLNREIDRLIASAIAGLVALILAVFAAYLLGRGISRPVKRLAAAADRIRELRLDEVEALPGSRITELNQQSKAFNAMVAGLHWFEAYVPKPLVRRLMGQGEGGVVSRSRNLTVLFTDIVGFSTYAEDRPAEEIAAFLNEHFAIVARCIEAEGGTVDKFIGDSVMAFWGAPEKQKDRAARACRAALAIGRALDADNDRRRANGLDPVRIRIGIHSGAATVGNIGTPDRVNYTVVGDMVNVAARMEQLGKELVTEPRTATILLTEATHAGLEDAFAFRSLGKHQVKGRAEPIEVYELVAADADE